MGKVRKRPEEFEAEQWQPGVTISGVDVQAKIHWSEDRCYYYITRGGDCCRYWLSGAKLPCPIPNNTNPQALQWPADWLKFRDGNVEYYRKALPFAFWKVRSGPVEAIDATSAKFKDYAAVHGWSPLGPDAVYVRGLKQCPPRYTGRLGSDAQQRGSNRC